MLRGCYRAVPTHVRQRYPSESTVGVFRYLLQHLSHLAMDHTGSLPADAYGEHTLAVARGQILFLLFVQNKTKSEGFCLQSDPQPSLQAGMESSAGSGLNISRPVGTGAERSPLGNGLWCMGARRHNAAHR